MSAFENHGITILQGDCVAVMRELEAESVDAVVCDPPYDLTAGKRGGSGAASVALDSPYGRARIGAGNGAGGFMGAAWDATGVAFDPATWREALRVLKPGGHLLAFGGTRTSHRLTCAIEDAGFEIRDCLMWLYGSGFPKSLDVSKAIDKAAGAEREVVGYRESMGYPDGGTAYESNRNGGPGNVGFDRGPGGPPITAPATPEAAAWEGWGTALKPSYEPVVLARKPLAGTVSRNVLEHGTGALNIGATRIGSSTRTNAGAARHERRTMVKGMVTGTESVEHDYGRWPANVCMDEDAAALLDAEVGERPSGSLAPYTERHENASSYRMARDKTFVKDADSGGPSRYFYTAKAGAAERDGASHPTVKPLDLMRWLVRLVTPPNGLILDPFLGSGTTAIAAQAEGFRCIGIEREPEYVEQAIERINRRLDPANARSLERDREPDPALLSLFGAPTVEQPVESTGGNGRAGEASAERRYTERGGTNFAPLPGRRRSD